jgi:uncharacterized protein (TIGR03084 family)
MSVPALQSLAPALTALAEEMAALDATLARLNEADWMRVSPFKDWTILDHVSHLALSDQLAASAARDPQAFRAMLAVPRQGKAADPTGSPNMPPIEMLQRWREGGQALQAAFVGVDPAARLPWFGPDMSPRSFVNARLMETWAHGQTIHDTLRLRRMATDRIRPICDLGWRTVGWSFRVHGLPAPQLAIRLVLSAPSGETWAWGPETADNSVEGAAEDFALVVCQCRNVADTGLKTTGQAAADWMAIAQCFAGAASMPPAPGTRVVEWKALS